MRSSPIRRASSDDIPALVALMYDFYAEADFPLDRQEAAVSFAALMADESRGAVWLAFDEGAPAGYVVLTVRFSMEYGGLDAFIDDLFVRPDGRGKGLGKALLGVLFAECARRNVKAVHVEVGAGNTVAQGLYASYGLRLGEDDRQVLTVRLR